MTASSSRIRKFVTLSDIHFPYEDKETLALVRAFLSDFHPDELYLNGDIFDCPQISKYARSRKEVVSTGSLQEHIDLGHEGLALITDAASARKNFFIKGNHEYRWEPYLGTRAPEIASLRALDFDQVFDLKGWTTCEYGEGFWVTEDLFMYHGEAIGKGWLDKERQKSGTCTITGHHHQQGVSYHTDRTRTYKNVGQGCLCQLNPPYLRTPPSWQQGFVYGYIFGQEKFRAIEVEIVHGSTGRWMAPEGQLYK